MTSVTLIFVVLATFTSPRFFVAKTLAYQLLTCFMCVHAVAAISYACYKKVEGAAFFPMGIMFLLVGTVLDILSVQGYVTMPPMGGFGLFAFTFFQSTMIARKFSSAFKRVKISEKAIRRLPDDLKREHEKVLTLNTNLERMVEEKTRDIRSIMEHIPLGIFMIKPDFHIHKDHSRHLKDVLMVTPEQMENAVATDLLFQNSTLSSDARSQAFSVLDSTLGASALNFEVNAHALPTEIKQVVEDRSRVFDLTWNVIENSDGDVDKVLVTIRDVTELRKLQEMWSSIMPRCKRTRVFVHLLRNSMDHGLETAAERSKKGKEPVGHIRVSMQREGERLHLVYEDDGRGLHVTRIRDIGIARGLISEDVNYTAAALAELIFDSGLSTANQVSDISGRGVGIDAFRSFLQEAGGSITIHLGEEKEPGFFALRFLIDLPFLLFEERLPSGGQRAV